MKQVILVSPMILNIVLVKTIPKWISKSELSYRSIWYPWHFQIMFPSSEILVKRYSNAWELDTLIICVCRPNQCMCRSTEFFPAKLLEVRLGPYWSLQMVVRLFEWSARGETSYLQNMQNTHLWSFPNLGWIRPGATFCNFRSDSLNKGLGGMISKSIFKPALFHDSLLLCICD